VPAYLPDTPHVRNDRARSYDLMAALDGELAARLAELDADGLTEDTIVFYCGDNGGALPWSKRHATEDGLRVPLVVRYPRRWAHVAPAPPGSVVDSPVTLTDLGPTVLSLAGLEVPRYAEGQVLAGRRRLRRYAFGGRARMDERYDLVRTVTDGRLRYIRNYQPHRPYGQVYAYAWQQKGYQDWQQGHLDGTLDEVQRRFWLRRPAEELYLTRNDPDHVHDLATDPRFRRHLHRLRHALDSHMLRVNDNGFIPEGAPLQGFESSRRPGAYPLRRVKAVADRAIARDPRHVRGFVAGLGDGNEVVRYWSAMGLLMLCCDGVAVPHGPTARRWDAEPSASVKVVLSEVLLKPGAHPPALSWLVDVLDGHPDARVRLQALNALTYLGPVAAPALPAVERAATDADEYLRGAARYLSLVLRGRYTPQTPLYG
jgi:hypothetical protein